MIERSKILFKPILRIFKIDLFKSSAIYSTANLVNASIPFILLPILTRYLSPGDYGIIAMVTITIGFVTPFVGINVHGAITRVFFKKDEFDFGTYISNSLLILFLSSLLVSIIFLIFKNVLSSVTSIPEEWLQSIVIICFAQFVGLIYLNILQVNLKPLFYGIFQITQTFLNLTLTLFFVVYLNKSWEGRIEAHIFSSVVFSIIAFYLLRKSNLIKFTFNGKAIKHALAFGLPLIPHSISGIVIAMSDRYFLTNMIGIDETGVYTVAYQLGSVFSLLTTSFNNAFVPWLFERLSRDSFQEKLNIIKFTYSYFGVLILIAIAGYFILPYLLPLLVGKAFISSSKYIFWILLAFAFNGMYLMVTNYIFYAEKTKYLSIVSSAVAVLNLPVTYFLIKVNGAIGAAQAMAIAFFSLFIFTWYLSSRIYSMPWKLVKIEENL